MDLYVKFKIFVHLVDVAKDIADNARNDALQGGVAEYTLRIEQTFTIINKSINNNGIIHTDTNTNTFISSNNLTNSHPFSVQF